jgi:glucan 1,3-beta-glucosidase
VDEYTLSQYLGRDQARAELEIHYATFVRRQSFQDIRDAGFNHVRMSFPYWIIENVNPNDPYVEEIGWRYLLRAIEWAREVGLRINICLHAAPGSQNGWNHRYLQTFCIVVNYFSGRQGTIGWLNGYHIFDLTKRKD